MLQLLVVVPSMPHSLLAVSTLHSMGFYSPFSSESIKPVNDVASFPGPTLFVTCSTGNKASKHKLCYEHISGAQTYFLNVNKNRTPLLITRFFFIQSCVEQGEPTVQFQHCFVPVLLPSCLVIHYMTGGAWE